MLIQYTTITDFLFNAIASGHGEHQHHSVRFRGQGNVSMSPESKITSMPSFFDIWETIMASLHS